MDLVELVGWAVFAMIIGWLGAILYATWRQIENEARESGLIEPREDRNR